MFSICIRGHMMIAHSFRGELFGPAQRLHGATYVIDVELRRKELGPEGVVVDIGRASTMLNGIIAELDYRNLDDEPAFASQNTTTEFLAKTLFDRMVARMAKGELGAGGDAIASMKVTLHESHVAWAAYEGAVG